jgi:hypothetical protein
MPRAKKVQEEPQQETQIEPNFQDKSDEQLVQHFIQLDDWVKAEKKRFDNFMEAPKQELDVIRNEFLRRLNERGSDSTKTECGTAYKSRLLNVSVTPEDTVPYQRDPNAPVSTGREALLDFALDNWETIGNELLLIDAQKDSVRKYMEENNGLPPPGVRAVPFIKVNVRRA